MKKDNGISIAVSVRAGVVGRCLFLLAFALTIAHVICMLLWYKSDIQFSWAYVSYFDLDQEQSFGTWFSTLNLFVAALLTILQAVILTTAGGRKKIYWWILGLVFCALSADEVAGIHETVNTVITSTRWTTFGAIFVLLMGLAYIPFILALPARIRILLISAGAIYVGGAVGVEWFTWWYPENPTMDTLSYNLWTALEEFMEMTGIILYNYALIIHISDERESTQLHLDFQPPVNL